MICGKRKVNYCSWKELIVGVVRVVQPFAEWPFPQIYDCQSNQRKIFFIYSRISVFSLRDYVGNARNAGMLLRLSLQPSNKRIPKHLIFFQLCDSGLFLELQNKS